jgi:hypothetical protein
MFTQRMPSGISKSVTGRPSSAFSMNFTHSGAAMRPPVLCGPSVRLSS